MPEYRADLGTPLGFTTEEWAVAERFCDLLDWYLSQGFELDEAQVRAKESMSVERAFRLLRS
jgi:hypothetical protein